MLDVLRKTSDLGRLPDIVFFLQYIVGRNPISLKDATVVSDNTSGKDSGVFTITAPSSITKDETTYY